jgi:UDP-3-O-[3-hydroxymyristoyl] N-acetylglucosamine deacetylase
MGRGVESVNEIQLMQAIQTEPPVDALPAGSADYLLSAQQHTLASSLIQTGLGLHSGLPTQVKILPAEVGSGRSFVRVDLPGSPSIPAQVAQVGQTLLSTELGRGEATVRTVEHLLAALSALGVDNARIEIDGPEVPLLDGSAQNWVEAILLAGIVPQSEPRIHYKVQQPVWLQEGDAFVAALPAPDLRFTYGIDFDLPAIGNQWQSWSPQQISFAEAIAPARTFGLAHQIEMLRQQGLIQGGSLENALVCGESGWVNPPLRFSNEPVRHKLLDLVGDLSLLGSFPRAHFLAYKASHQLHIRFADQLRQVLLP